MNEMAELGIGFEDMPLKKPLTTKKEIKKMETKKTTKPAKAPAVKEPKSIKLSTIWKALVYTFAVIGVVLTVVYINDIVSNVVESRAEARAQEILNAQPQVAPQSKVNQ